MDFRKAVSIGHIDLEEVLNDPETRKSIQEEILNDLEFNKSVEKQMLAFARKRRQEIPEALGTVLMEFTLTSLETDPSTMLKEFHKVMDSKMHRILKWSRAIELTKDGKPHIHAMLICDRKHIPRPSYVKKIIHARFSLQRVRIAVAYEEYMKKERNNKLVQDFCVLYNIKQFESSDALPEKELRPLPSVAGCAEDSDGETSGPQGIIVVGKPETFRE